jgi:hypothetical protein
METIGSDAIVLIVAAIWLTIVYFAVKALFTVPLILNAFVIFVFAPAFGFFLLINWALISAHDYAAVPIILVAIYGVKNGLRVRASRRRAAQMEYDLLADAHSRIGKGD